MIEVRLGRAQDAAFIYATWLKSYKHESQFARRISNAVFYKWHHMAIDRIAGRGGRFYIAHSKGDPDTILGFICVEGAGLVHYCYVKKTFRNMGIATALLKAVEFMPNSEFTHWTTEMSWVLKKYPDLIYNPYVL